MNRQTSFQSAIAAVAAGIMGVASSTAVQAQTTQAYDLTVPNGGSALINNGYFFPRYNTGVVSGSGTYGPFLRVQKNGSEEGFNSDNGTPLDTKNGVAMPNSALRTPANSPNNSLYYSFSLDINETASASATWISLDDLKVFVSSTPVPNTVTTLAGLHDYAGDPVYDMDDGSWNQTTDVQTVTYDRTILLDYQLVSSGSGVDDLIFLLPQSVIPAGPNVYITFYTRFGTVFSGSGTSFLTKDWSSDAGFEEWRTVSGLTINIPPPVPEASTSVAIVASLAGLGGLIWSRRRQTR